MKTTTVENVFDDLTPLTHSIPLITNSSIRSLHSDSNLKTYESSYRDTMSSSVLKKYSVPLPEKIRLIINSDEETTLVINKS